MKTFMRLKSVMGVVLIVTLFFIIIATIVADKMSEMMVSEAEKTVRSVVRNTIGKIDQLTLGVETAVANQRWIVQERLDDPDFMFKITRELVENNEYIYGSTMAYRPGYFKDRARLFAPYSFMSTNGVIKSIVFGADYNYPEWSWYSEPIRLKCPVWSEPYFDEGGGDILMSTYSIPVFGTDSNICAVLTADLSLKRLTEHVASICPYPQSYAVLKSASGALLVAPPEGRAADIPRGKTITISDKADNGWSVEIVCPTEELLRSSHTMTAGIIGFSVVALVAIFVVSWFFSSRLERTTMLHERMASELNTAQTIQIGLLRRVFPARVWAVLHPAREVGGDFYDCVRKGDRTYFIVGDASGKGVPAALFSLVAGTVFRLACNLKLSAGEILGWINASLAANNDMSMFFTTFVGVLDTKTGILDFGCAGHNAPVIIRPDGSAEFLGVNRRPPTGAMVGIRYEQQSVKLEPGTKVLAYTDGITEAERKDHSQYGDRRLLEFAAAHAGDEPQELIEALVASVNDFAGDNEQFDDITALCLEVSV